LLSRGHPEVPIAPVLRDLLAEHKARTDRSGEDFVFGSAADRPFTPTAVRRRALTAWRTWNEAETERAEKEARDARLLVPVGLHECRHSFVSMMHDAGFSLEEIGDYVGHTSTFMTDRYRHLLPGSAGEAGRRFGDYLARANTLNRLAQLETGAHEPENGFSKPKP
jgi:integrase